MRHEDWSFDMTTVGSLETIGEPQLKKVCVIRVEIGPALEFPTTQGTVRAMFPITGGVALGDGWKGRILPGGADFAIELWEAPI